MKVKDCMCSQVICVKPDAKISEVSKIMKDSGIGCLPVCGEDNKIVGILTDRDIVLRCLACDKDYKNESVSEIMTTDIYSVKPEDTLIHASEKMCDCQVKRIPVLEDGIVKGIITLGDLARNPEISDQFVGKTKTDICSGEKNKA